MAVLGGGLFLMSEIPLYPLNSKLFELKIEKFDAAAYDHPNKHNSSRDDRFNRHLYLVCHINLVKCPFFGNILRTNENTPYDFSRTKIAGIVLIGRKKL